MISILKKIKDFLINILALDEVVAPNPKVVKKKKVIAKKKKVVKK